MEEQSAREMTRKKSKAKAKAQAAAGPQQQAGGPPPPTAGPSAGGSAAHHQHHQHHQRQQQQQQQRQPPHAPPPGHPDQKQDLYEVLGLERTCSAADVKRAFRTLALQNHPDKNAGCPDAKERFQRINKAYAVLSDEDKRALYDRYGEEDEDDLEDFVRAQRSSTIACTTHARSRSAARWAAWGALQSGRARSRRAFKAATVPLRSPG